MFHVKQSSLLRRYADRLAHWQRTTNLVSPVDAAADLVAALSPTQPNSRGLHRTARLWLDLGSGGGFPGMVIAILRAKEADFRMHLVESNHKKCAFLGEVARAAQGPCGHPSQAY